jgi:phosphomannomutase
MTERLIISISGLRGIVGENLTPSVADDYGRAFGTYLHNRRADKRERLSVCIGRDSRPSGEMLKTAVAQGLGAAGIDVIDLAIVTTPGVSIMTTELGCSGGVVITASHNPAPYNGIKLLSDNGIAPLREVAEQIKHYFLGKNFVGAGESDKGAVTSNDRTDATHIAKVLAIVDKEAVAAKNFKVALDSVNGAGGRVTKKILAQLDCEVVAINDEPTGDFAHPPEPTARNVTTLCDVVKNEKAAVGFAQDPDADRLAIVDEGGRYIGEEYSLALAARYVFSKHSGAAATNLSTSRMIDDIAAQAGAGVIRTPVGEANVAAAMIENNCVIGGEGNGGVIDLRVCPVRDSLVGMALVLQLMAETSKPVSQLVDEIRSYHMVKDKFVADESQAGQILKAAESLFAGAKLDSRDGCRFDFGDGWVHLRSSNTEPIMRVIVEAENRQAAQRYIDRICNIRKEVLG